MKTKRLILAIGLVLATIILPSCATMFTGSTQTITVISDPPSADVYLNLQCIGQSGVPLKVKRSDLDKLLTVRKTGYQDYCMEIPTRTNLAYYGNIPFIFFGVGMLGAYWDVAYDNHISVAGDGIYNVKLIFDKNE